VKDVAVWKMNHTDSKVTHTFGADRKAVPATSTLSAQPDRNGFSYTFPAHSLTILKLKVE